MPYTPQQTQFLQTLKSQGVSPEEAFQRLNAVSGQQAQDQTGQQNAGVYSSQGLPTTSPFYDQATQQGSASQQAFGGATYVPKQVLGAVGQWGQQYLKDKIGNPPQGQDAATMALNATGSIAGDVAMYPLVHAWDAGKAILGGLTNLIVGGAKTLGNAVVGGSEATSNLMSGMMGFQPTFDTKGVENLAQNTRAGLGQMVGGLGEAVTAPLKILPDVVQTGLGAAYKAGVSDPLRAVSAFASKATGVDPTSVEGQQRQQEAENIGNMVGLGLGGTHILDPAANIFKIYKEGGFDPAIEAGKQAIQNPGNFVQNVGTSMARRTALNLSELPTDSAQYLAQKGTEARTAGTPEGEFSKSVIAQDFPTAKINFFNQAKNTIDQWVQEKGEAGAEYNPIKQDTTPLSFNPSTDLAPLIESKTGLKLNEDGKFEFTGDSKIRTQGDVNAIQKFYDTYKNYNPESNPMIASTFLNMREDAGQNLANFGDGGIPTGKLGPAGAGIYAALNDQVRGQIPGLEGLDNQFEAMKAPAQRLMNLIYDNKGGIKNNAIQTIYNILKNPESENYKVLEQAFGDKFGDFQEQFKTTKLVGDIQKLREAALTGKRTGKTISTIIGAGLGSVIPGVGTFAGGLAGYALEHYITDPSVIIPMIEKYGAKLFPTEDLQKVTGKIQKGDTLSQGDLSKVSDALDHVQESDITDYHRVERLNNSTDQRFEQLKQILPDEFQNYKIGFKNVRKDLATKNAADNMNTETPDGYNKVWEKESQDFMKELKKASKTPAVSVKALLDIGKDWIQHDFQNLHDPNVGDVRNVIMQYMFQQIDQQTNGMFGRYLQKIGEQQGAQQPQMALPAGREGTNPGQTIPLPAYEPNPLGQQTVSPQDIRTQPQMDLSPQQSPMNQPSNMANGVAPEQPPSFKQGALPEGKPEIVPTKELRTFDFHELEGQKQTLEENAKIHENIINNPDKPMTSGGESFSQAASRAINKVQEIMKEGENVAITTHNSMYGLLKLWSEEGQPKVLDQTFREKYTKQDNSNPTGSSFEIKGDKGIIYVVRHGETADNVAGNFRSANTTLTDKGIQQAQDLASELKDKGITKIYSSDLPRAMETSKIIQNGSSGFNEAGTAENTKPLSMITASNLKKGGKVYFAYDNADGAAYAQKYTTKGITQHEGASYPLQRVTLSPEAKIFDMRDEGMRNELKTALSPTAYAKIERSLKNGVPDWRSEPPTKVLQHLGYDGVVLFERPQGMQHGSGSYENDVYSLAIFNPKAYQITK